MAYNPHHNGVAAVGRTSRPDELYRIVMLTVLLLVPIDSILGHSALNRVLESSAWISWTLAVFVSATLAFLAHVIGHLFARRAWRLGAVFAFVWMGTVGGMAVVRWLESGESPSTGGGLSMDTATEPSLASSNDGRIAAMVLMVSIFLLTGALSAFAGAHRTPLVEMRSKALASAAATETEFKEAAGDLKRAEELHVTHTHQLEQIDMEAARAIQAQRQLTQLLVVRAAIALREKSGDATNDFHLQAPAQPVPNGEAERLLRALDAGTPAGGSRA